MIGDWGLRIGDGELDSLMLKVFCRVRRDRIFDRANRLLKATHPTVLKPLK